ncbi:MAG TPA: helix-turn-helix transcriptional regulator [Vicinamibacterales bacterium]|nr:helix-turn-helix transcriptional regulator [Vicinamibacterales bacterium]
MSEREAHELLKQARVERRLDHATIARRTGVREALLVAMEAGLWDRLPHGLYARAAVRSYASFLGLDPDAILRSCEASLPAPEDPIAGLARVRGLKPQKAELPGAKPREIEARTTPLLEHVSGPSARWPDRRRLSMMAAALAIDSALIAAPLLLAVGAAAVLNRVPPSAMEHGAGAFGAFGALMALLYFLCFAGVAGSTIGERVTGTGQHAVPSTHTLAAVRDRALAAAFRDLRSIAALGVRIGRLTLRRVGPNGTVDGERLAF